MTARPPSAPSPPWKVKELGEMEYSAIASTSDDSQSLDDGARIAIGVGIYGGIALLAMALWMWLSRKRVRAWLDARQKGGGGSASTSAMPVDQQCSSGAATAPAPSIPEEEQQLSKRHELSVDRQSSSAQI